MAESLAERLRTAHQRRFVGRKEDLAAFEDALDAEVPPFAVLFIHGPGGVGKTALTTEMRYRCADRSIPVHVLDARNVEPTPPAAMEVLRDAGLDLDDLEDVSGEQHVLFIDTLEAWTPLYAWMRQSLIPQLPASFLVVLSGRTPPPADWQSDLGLGPLLEVRALRNLPRRLGETYLEQRGVAEAHHESILAFAHGHPLALSLAADLAEQASPDAFEPIESPDLVGTLVRRFLERAPSPEHRRALEACALVRVCTEPVLTAVLSGLDEADPSATDRTATDRTATDRTATDRTATDGPASPTAPGGNGRSEAPGRDPGGESDSAVSPRSDAHELFSWLRELSFTEAGVNGLFPHDVVRTAITADLRWRDADTFDRLQHRARTYYLDRLDAVTSGSAARRAGSVDDARARSPQEILTDYLFLFRHNPVIRPFFQRLRDAWNAEAPPVRDAATTDDVDALRAMVVAHEGDASAECFDHWWDRSASDTQVFRNADGDVVGFVLTVDLRETTDDDRRADPAIETAHSFLADDAPLRPGETASYFRFWMSRDAYQDISPVQSLISAYRVRHYLTTPSLAYTFIPTPEPERWELLFAYGDMHRVEEAAFTVGDRTYAVFGHDWRAVPPRTWLDRLADRDLSPAMPSPTERAEPTMLVLSRSDFDDAVKAAFKAHARPEAMHGNPLLQSRLLDESTGLDADVETRIEALRDRLEEAVRSLDQDPKTAKYYRAVRATYLNPQPTQERAAEHLGLAFSTYRRYLKRGIDHVADLLWREEVGAQE